MDKTHDLPTTQYLNEVFTYSQETGELFWKHRPRSHFKSNQSWSAFNSRFAGKLAGNKECNPDGSPKCISIRLRYGGRDRLLRAHRIIYALMGIEIPEGFEVDHWDTCPFNNRWLNMRLATRAQNGANQKVHKNRKHKHLPKGVSPKRKSFRAQIGFEGKQIGLGTFSTPEAAHAAYCAKAQELYGEFARGN